MTKYGVILFYTTSAAFKAEKALKNAGIECKLIPPPRELSNDCGVAARFYWERKDRVEEVLAASSVEISTLCLMPDAT